MNGGTTHSFQTPPQVYPAFDGHGSTNETKLGLFYGMNCTYPSPVVAAASETSTNRRRACNSLCTEKRVELVTQARSNTT